MTNCMNPANFAEYLEALEREEFKLVDQPVSSDEFWRGIGERIDAESVGREEDLEMLLTTTVSEGV